MKDETERESPMYSIAELRRQLPTFVREAEAGGSVRVTRRGRPVAVLIGLRRYQELVAGKRSFKRTYEKFAATMELAKLEIDPDRVFAGARDQSSGRTVDL